MEKLVDADKKWSTNPNPRDEWIAVPVPPSGIPHEWIREARKNVASNVRPFTSLGGGKERQRHFYYVCSRGRRNGPDACQYFRYHPAEELEHRVRRVVLDLGRRPETLRESLRADIEAEKASTRNIALEVETWNSKLRDVDKKRSGYQDLAAEGLLTIDELRTKLKALEAERATARAELEALKEPEDRLERLEMLPALMEDFIAELPQFVYEDEAHVSERMEDLYRRLNLSVLARKDGTLEISGTFGHIDLGAEDPGPFIGVRATEALDSEAYEWTKIPPPDDPVWDTWKEGDPVRSVCQKSPTH